MPCPGEEGGALGEHPVEAPVEVDGCEGGGGGADGEEGAEGGGGGDGLVEEGDAQRGAG